MVKVITRKSERKLNQRMTITEAKRILGGDFKVIRGLGDGQYLVRPDGQDAGLPFNLKATCETMTQVFGNVLHLTDGDKFKPSQIKGTKYEDDRKYRSTDW